MGDQQVHALMDLKGPRYKAVVDYFGTTINSYFPLKIIKMLKRVWRYWITFVNLYCTFSFSETCSLWPSFGEMNTATVVDFIVVALNLSPSKV